MSERRKRLHAKQKIESARSMGICPTHQEPIQILQKCGVCIAIDFGLHSQRRRTRSTRIPPISPEKFTKVMNRMLDRATSGKPLAR